MKKLFTGSHLVAIGASLWATDSFFRSRLTGNYSPLLIVFITLLMCAIVTVPICWSQRKTIYEMKRSDWGAFLFLAIGSNILAMVAFTYAFSLTTNYSIPILIQKIKPLVSIFLAVLFLKEKLHRKYYFLAPIAILGSLMVGLGGGHDWSLQSLDFKVILFSLVAAALWGAGTIFDRYTSLRFSFSLVTSFRYLLATFAMIFCLPLVYGEWSNLQLHFANDIWLFIGMAFLSGLLPLFIYYQGMKVTRASVACLLELAYPLTAVLLNWIFLGSILNSVQIVGALLIVASVTILSLETQQ